MEKIDEIIELLNALVGTVQHVQADLDLVRQAYVEHGKAIGEMDLKFDRIIRIHYPTIKILKKIETA